MSRVFPIIAPHLNVNDEEMLIGRWLVKHGITVTTGDPLCEMETSKAVAELNAEHNGILFQSTAPGSVVKVGDRIGLIGSTIEEIESYLSKEKIMKQEKERSGVPKTEIRATPKAQALAKQYGVLLSQVAAQGVRGAIKEADVLRYVEEQKTNRESPAESRTTSVPPEISRHVNDEGELSRHELAVAQNLRQSLNTILLATMETDLDLSPVKHLIQLAQGQGLMLSLLHVALHALGRALPHHPRLISFHHNNRVYRYRELNVAFVVKTGDQRLYAPVVRQADKLSVNQVAQACHAVAMRIHRGKVELSELEGACFTVSCIAAPTISRFMALPNRFQSAILAIAGERSILMSKNGQITMVPGVTLTLTYDHALCDGSYAAEFLGRLVSEISRTTMGPERE